MISVAPWFGFHGGYVGMAGKAFQRVVLSVSLLMFAVLSFGQASSQTAPKQALSAKDEAFQNLRYYDDYPAARKKELSARLDQATIDSLNLTFLEQKHVIDPEKLAVIAFLQENQTKGILQAAYISVGKAR